MIEPTDLKTLQQELEEALRLINDYSATHNDTSNAELDTEGLNNTQSLLERCAAIVEQDNVSTKPTLRIIHHFACSGGTLISKCLAAQPNVFLLSELHPTTRLGFNFDKAQYTPRDVITQAIYGRIPNVDSLSEKIFVQNIIETEKHVRNLGGYLVIRAHSHSDYCTHQPLPEIDTITRLLCAHFNIINLVTIRNPVESFLSLRKNGWVHFQPDTFDEYCKRLLAFLDSFHFHNVIRYEDFVISPEDVLKLSNEILDLPTCKYATDYKDMFKVSGDSGRVGLEINSRPRRAVDKLLMIEIESSNSFKKLCEYYGFSF